MPLAALTVASVIGRDDVKTQDIRQPAAARSQPASRSSPPTTTARDTVSRSSSMTLASSGGIGDPPAAAPAPNGGCA
jgi:hypothetical protein